MKIPKFKSEKEERTFWNTHSVADYLEDTEEIEETIQISEKLKSKIKQRKKKLLTIRLDEEIIEATKKAAYKKAVGYQTLMRMWIVEGLNRDKIKF